MPNADLTVRSHALGQTLRGGAIFWRFVTADGRVDLGFFDLILEYSAETVLRTCGVLGFLTYVMTYLMVSLRFLTSEHLAYYALNIVAASLMLLSLALDFNLGSALIQSFWIVIGFLAIILRIGWRARGRSTDISGRLG